MVTRHDELLRLHFHCLLCFFGALLYNSNFPLIMTEKQKNELLQDVCAAMEGIHLEVLDDVIKDYEIPPLVNTKTGQCTGFAIVIQLSGRYNYNEDTLKDWKHKLKADEWFIGINSNRLYVTFKVRYKEDKL